MSDPVFSPQTKASVVGGVPSFSSAELIAFAHLFARTRRTETDCLEYPYSICKTNGYPRIFKKIGEGKRKEFRLSRWVMHIVAGFNLNDKKWILHKCDNKLCINPSHLYVGDRKQNVKDMVDRNRIRRGERHPWAKHSDALIAILRAEHAKGVKRKELHTKYSVPLSTLDAYLKGTRR